MRSFLKNLKAQVLLYHNIAIKSKKLHSTTAQQMMYSFIIRISEAVLIGKDGRLFYENNFSAFKVF